MKLRELPGALILGLLASLLAHTASFGGEHAAGGRYHDALCSLALAGAGGFVVLVALAAWAGAGRLTQGSVLAARLAPLVPGPEIIGAFAAPCFFGIEAIEGRPESLPLALMAIAVVVSSYVLSRLAHLFVRAIADAAVAIASHTFAPRLPLFVRRAARRPRAHAARYVRRRFARPPPQPILAHT